LILDPAHAIVPDLDPRVCLIVTDIRAVDEIIAADLGQVTADVALHVDEILSEKVEVNIPWEKFTYIQE
ncbi:MAG: hypothetical protein IIW08_07865, partial [Clostridia bacterium]|nr:hypothetical protein [Clostridia bacterium]